MDCDLCHEPIDPRENNFYKVEGWVQKRDAGGTNHIHLRKQVPGVAHPHCMKLADNKINPAQGSLI